MYSYRDGWHNIAGIQMMVRGGKVAWLDGGISLERWNKLKRCYESCGGELTPRAVRGQLERGNLRFKNAKEFVEYAKSIGVEIKEDRV